ncbi:BspA family leucine-rich repeat surface protein [Mycoplasma feriruminatoris]|uniref:BspA family leucine-rich repeat surface protein n=1 Tax=Mycoplasma feriruminatoris TaxID=1179777 RepID=UPI00241EB72A|nr:BspA family leucine-rich repeat surface protein [Mycoplasma feriruminatoris]WFQ95823.1 BspA family leucine-rich repeat surface protein [Mycoplasma feriruminatoris]
MKIIKLASFLSLSISSLFVISCTSKTDNKNINNLNQIFKDYKSSFSTFHSYNDVLDQIKIYANDLNIKDLQLKDINKKNNLLIEDNIGNKNKIDFIVNKKVVSFYLDKVLKNKVETIYNNNKSEVIQLGYKKDGSNQIILDQISNLTIKVPKHLPLKINSLKSAFYESNAIKIENLDKWNTSNIIDASEMFKDAKKFNQNLNNWNVEKLQTSESMFEGAFSFNQNLNNWKTTSLKNTSKMFWSAVKFNQNLNNWNTKNVTNMSKMFKETYMFNQNISNWNTDNVENMEGMFSNATSFDQNLSSWKVDKVTNATGFKENINLSKDKLPKFDKNILDTIDEVSEFDY